MFYTKQLTFNNAKNFYLISLECLDHIIILGKINLAQFFKTTV